LKVCPVARNEAAIALAALELHPSAGKLDTVAADLRGPGALLDA